MIDPNKVTDFNRTEAQLEEFLLFAILVAGKKSDMMARKLELFLYGSRKALGLPSDTTPFQLLEYLIKCDLLDPSMKKFKLGVYTKLNKCFTGILQFKGKLNTVTIEELESVFGIAEKTSRFFILHSRPNQQIAALDTHILKWLNELEYPNVPKNTPSGKKYQDLEKAFLYEANIREVSPADLDLTIWKKYANA
jgi:hypothetical protein